MGKFQLQWRFTGPILGGLFLLLLGGYVITNVYAGQELERELTSVREKGEPLTLREIAPPPLPDEENAALLYVKAFTLLPRTKGNGKKQITDEDTVTYSRFISDVPAKKHKVTLDQVREALNGTEAALALIRQAAAMPQARFPVDWEAGAAANFPHHSKLRSLSRLMAAHAKLSAIEGRPNVALDDIEAIIGMARHTLHEPILIGQLVGYACLNIASQTLEQVLDYTQPDIEDSRHLIQTLGQLDIRTAYTRSLQGERATGLWIFNLREQNPREFLPMIRSADSPEGPFNNGLVQGAYAVGAPIFKLDQAFYLQYMAEQIEQSRLETSEYQVLQDDDLSRYFPRYALISRLIAPTLSQATLRRNETLARIALCHWGLALNAYHRLNGAYPSTLKEAADTLKQELPEDPFTGKSLHYRPQGNGYLLYSVGGNRKDDGGRYRSAPEPSGTPANAAERPDDIAWWVNVDQPS